MKIAMLILTEIGRMTIPTYDFPQSPILIIGFFGIFFTLVLLYFVNRAYFDSPLNMDNIHRNKDS
jgi:hypothetical protein